MKKIRIGIMGCASIAERSMIPALKKLPEWFEVVAIASRDMEKAKAFAERFGCEPVCGYDALIRRSDIDAVYMPLPTGLHREWVLKTLEAGKHVYAEKSIASGYKDCEAFIQAARQADLVLMEGYMFLYHSQHQKVFEILNSGAIGEIRHFSAAFGFPPLNKNNFRYDRQLGGGAIMDCAGYTVRAASFILGEPLTVKSSCIKYNETGASIYGSGFLVSAGGVPVSVSFGFDNFYQCKYEIWGSKGKITALKAFTPKEKESPVLLLETNEGMKQFVCDSDNHFEKAMIEFARRIQLGRQSFYDDEILQQSRLLEQISCYSK